MGKNERIAWAISVVIGYLAFEVALNYLKGKLWTREN